MTNNSLEFHVRLRSKFKMNVEGVIIDSKVSFGRGQGFDWVTRIKPMYRGFHRVPTILIVVPLDRN